jgi:hypothetical protein
MSAEKTVEQQNRLYLYLSPSFYSAFTDKVERNCHFPAAGWNYMTHRQALQVFPYISQASLNKINKFSLRTSAVPVGIWYVTVSSKFISERTVYSCLPSYTSDERIFIIRNGILKGDPN